MTRRHIEALKVLLAVHRRAEETFRLLGGDDDTDDDDRVGLDGATVTNLRTFRKQPVSWATTILGTRVAIQGLERVIVAMSAVKPKTLPHPRAHTKAIRLLRSILEDMKAALAVMEALPPWTPPPNGGGNRVAA